jgi:NAD(P)-dependent dehydrogenase (short-subunit alcohol dehydrogenase family)
MFSLAGKVAVVTGALGLIGKHHCHALAEAGAHVVVTDLDDHLCREFAETLRPEAMGCSIDITEYDSVTKLKTMILEKFGHIDILVNNAAINDMFENPLLAAEQSKFENYPITLLEKSLKVNVTGTVICSQVLGTVMAENSGGSIINIASTYGIVSPDQSLYQDEHGKQVFYKSPAYPTTKGAVISFTKFLAAYWGEQNVRVNALSPGGVENGQDEFFINKYTQKTPLKRMARPIDYKGALIFLASDASAYMTGANLVVDGGFTIW